MPCPPTAAVSAISASVTRAAIPRPFGIIVSLRYAHCRNAPAAGLRPVSQRWRQTTSVRFDRFRTPRGRVVNTLLMATVSLLGDERRRGAGARAARPKRPGIAAGPAVREPPPGHPRWRVAAGHAPAVVARARRRSAHLADDRRACLRPARSRGGRDGAFRLWHVR